MTYETFLSSILQETRKQAGALFLYLSKKLLKITALFWTAFPYDRLTPP